MRHGDALHLSAETVHRAVGHFDHIVCENSLSHKELKGIALICTLLAAKLAERDPQVVRVASLFRKRVDVRRYEAQIMAHLNWDLQRVTAVEFVNFFLSQGIVFTSDSVNSSLPNERTAKSLRQYVE